MVVIVNIAEGDCGGGRDACVNLETTTAVFDPTFQAPKCQTKAYLCEALVIGKGSGLKTLTEIHNPNTIGDSCADGNGSTRWWALISLTAVNKVTVKSSTSNYLKAGRGAQISASVYVTQGDAVDFFHAADVSSPTDIVWDWKKTVTVTGNTWLNNYQTIRADYTLPSNGGEYQAVRVQLRAGGSGSGTDACVLGDYNDHDDVIFKVVGSGQTTQLTCLPHATKVRLHHSSYELLKIELQAFSNEGVNVAEGKTVTKPTQFTNEQDLTSATNTNDAAYWEIDLETANTVDSVVIINNCVEDGNVDCLCMLSGATLSLLDGAGEEISTILLGDTCGNPTLEYIFDASPDFCTEEEIAFQSTATSFIPAPAPVSKSERRLAKRPTCT